MLRPRQVELTLDVSPAAYSLWTPGAFAGSAPCPASVPPAKGFGALAAGLLMRVMARFPGSLGRQPEPALCPARVLGSGGPSAANARGQADAVAEWGPPRRLPRRTLPGARGVPGFVSPGSRAGVGGWLSLTSVVSGPAALCSHAVSVPFPEDRLLPGRPERGCPSGRHERGRALGCAHGHLARPHRLRRARRLRGLGQGSGRCAGVGRMGRWLFTTHPQFPLDTRGLRCTSAGRPVQSTRTTGQRRRERGWVHPGCAQPRP